ncbi:hypothetical protein BGX21_001905 [Mortierella sp. AD011]|nr:hypothetical protein BGX20_001584 [Mortierella sp. AD010]KAF9403609.1 hypothetical protein BGX21_001905 [Mortierella sp. AD011]
MFWATPIAVHNIVLALFKFLLSCAVGSILAIHSRFGDKYAGGEYAISIRWISKSDYLEMFHSARNSRKRVPTLTTFIMAFTIIISFVASNMDKLVTKYIHRSTALRDSSFIVTNSSQFTQFFSASTKFAGWTASIPYGANITDALTLMINDTRNIPDVNSRQVYTPRTFEYEIECDRFNAFVLDKGNDSMLLQNGGCTTGYFLPMLSETMDLSNVTIKKVSSGWWSMATPATPEQLTHLPSLMGSIVSTATDEWQCGSPELNVDLLLRPQFGLAAYPTTRVTKCILPSGEIRVLSVSTVQFSAFSFMIDEELLSPQLAFGISARMTFTEYDDLIQAMEYSISNVTFSQNATAAHYMASLGQNLYADYDEGQLYIIFDTQDIVKGWEMSDRLFYTVIGVMVACLVLWLLTQKMLDGIYTSSLYKIISVEVASRLEGPAKPPMLMTSQVDPVKVEGYDVVPEDEMYNLEAQ